MFVCKTILLACCLFTTALANGEPGSIGLVLNISSINNLMPTLIPLAQHKALQYNTFGHQFTKKNLFYELDYHNIQIG